MRVNFFNAH